MKIESFDAENILSKAKLKKTEARLCIVNFLLKSKKPVSSQVIFDKLQKENIDKVTVYRTLESLEKKGFVKRVHTGEREAQYEIADHTEDHHHVICLSCKKVSDFTGCDADILITKALKQVKDFKLIKHHSFDLFGICNSCSKK